MLRKTFSLRSFRFKLDPKVLRNYAHRLLTFEFELHFELDLKSDFGF